MRCPINTQGLSQVCKPGLLNVCVTTCKGTINQAWRLGSGNWGVVAARDRAEPWKRAFVLVFGVGGIAMAAKRQPEPRNRAQRLVFGNWGVVAARDTGRAEPWKRAFMLVFSVGGIAMVATTAWTQKPSAKARFRELGGGGSQRQGRTPANARFWGWRHGGAGQMMFRTQKASAKARFLELGGGAPETGRNPENERECGGLVVAVGLQARMLAFGVGGMVLG